MPDQMLDAMLAGALRERQELGLLRRRRPLQPIDATHVLAGDRQLVNFASNSYLGLSHHPALIAAAREALERYGVGSGASSLISGHSDLEAQAERALAQWKGCEAAILLPSGYQANVAAVQAIVAAARAAGRPVRLLLDKLAHASLIDAARASEAPMRIFPHNGMDKLRRLLASAPAEQIDVVVTESVFSMDGDVADLPALAQIKLDHPFVLVLDEAHASGVYGPAGSGWAAQVGHAGLADVQIVTLSKGLGVWGGAVCGSAAFCNALENFGRACIYTTAPPPVLAACVLAALRVMAQEPQRQQRVRELALRVRSALSLEAAATPADCPIVPISLGSEAAALAAAADLESRGLLVAAVRPPTVPRGTSRLRVTLSCEHTDEEVQRLIEALKRHARHAPAYSGGTDGGAT